MLALLISPNPIRTSGSNSGLRLQPESRSCWSALRSQIDDFPSISTHRKIITYKTESARDFEDFKTKITDGLKAWIRKEGSLGKLEPAPIESLAETSRCGRSR